MPNPFRGSEQPPEDPQLKKVLNSWQIFFITISGIIGTGLFSTNGGILSEGGPGGYILAIGIVGMIAVCFMDSLSEMVQAFPCANALAEYVEAFVDPDLATCVGVAYWFVWGIFWALMINGAAVDVKYWYDDISFQIPVMLILLPMAMVMLNLCHVNAFGWIETIGGSIKILTVVGVSLASFYLAGVSHAAEAYIDRGFVGSNPNANIGYNVCAALPMVAYSWIGLEIVAVAAFESKKLQNLKGPSQAVVFVVFVLYIVCAIGESLAIGSNDPGLPDSRVVPVKGSGIVSRDPQQPPTAYNSNAVIVLTALKNHESTLAGLFNGGLIYCAISAGNTSLYVASRALYGVALKKKARGYVGMTTLSKVNRYGVPWCSVLVTAACFFWIPLLQLAPRPTGLQDTALDNVRSANVESNRFVGWLGTVASLLGLIVWSTQLVAYIRYWHWLNIYKNSEILTDQFRELNRFYGYGRAQTLLGFAQPGIAYIGLITTLTVVIGFSSASWWQDDATAFAVTQTFAAPVLMLAAWLVLKALRYRRSSAEYPFHWYAKRKPGVEGLREVLNDMKFLSGEEMVHAPGAASHTDASSGSASGSTRGRDEEEAKSRREPSLQTAPVPKLD